MLGTDIENLNTEYPTETTVFQLAATTPETRRYWESYQSDGQTYIDPNGVGYYISKASRPTARYEKNFPQVTVGERSTKPTSGDWVSLTLQHGKAPKGASYEYAVLPHTDAAALKHSPRNPLTRFSGKTATPTLCVLRQTVLLLTSCLRLRRLCPTVDCCRKPIHRALS